MPRGTARPRRMTSSTNVARAASMVASCSACLEVKWTYRPLFPDRLRSPANQWTALKVLDGLPSPSGLTASRTGAPPHHAA